MIARTSKLIGENSPEILYCGLERVPLLVRWGWGFVCQVFNQLFIVSRVG